MAVLHRHNFTCVLLLALSNSFAHTKNAIPLRKSAQCGSVLRFFGVKRFPFDYPSSEFHPLGSGASADVVRVTYQDSDRTTVRKYHAAYREGGLAFPESDFIKEDKVYKYLTKKEFKHNSGYHGIWRDNDGRLYMEFDYEVGESYHNYIHRFYETNAAPKSELKRAIIDFSGVLSAFTDLHKAKVLHCDIKGANIFMSQNGNVKILDFSSAVIKGIFGFKDPTTMTPGYAAPEVEGLSKERVGYRSDIFSLGKVLELELVAKWSESFPDIDPQQKDSLLKSLQENVISIATHPSAKKRFASVEDFRRALIEWSNGLSE